MPGGRNENGRSIGIGSIRYNLSVNHQIFFPNKLLVNVKLILGRVQPVSPYPAPTYLAPTYLALLVLALLASSPVTAQDLLRDVTEVSGLQFRHFNGRTGELYFPEMTGQGAALFDADGDGDLDAYLVQGGYLLPGDRGKTLEKAPPGPLTDRLFIQTGLVDGVPRFEDRTTKSGLKAEGYGMGVACGDVDGDGFVDLFVANVGHDQLWRNRGDGTFEDWTAKAGVAGGATGWTVGAAFADFDADGHLDLVVIDYVRYDATKNVVCYAGSSRRDYCGPSAFPAVPNRLYRNRGDGTFEDWTARSGLGDAPGASLGVVADDFDGDGHMDIYVANDGQPNNLWLGSGDGKFRDEALLAGVALNREGQPEASMGVTVGDVDGDGDGDLFMTHLMGETNTLYLNQGGAFFEDRTIEMGLAGSSLSFTSFGTGFVDLDADGWLDLVALSGAVKIQEDQARRGDPYPLGQPNQIFLSRAGKGFAQADGRGGASFTAAEVSRGLALGDVDNDGDVDLLITNNHGPARLLLVDGAPTSWLGARVLRRAGKRTSPALGAWVELRPAAGASVFRRSGTDGSYASASDSRIVSTVPGTGPVEARVRWPDGKVEIFPGLARGRYHDLIQGTGSPAAAQARGAENAPPKS